MVKKTQNGSGEVWAASSISSLMLPCWMQLNLKIKMDFRGNLFRHLWVVLGEIDVWFKGSKKWKDQQETDQREDPELNGRAPTLHAEGPIFCEEITSHRNGKDLCLRPWREVAFQSAQHWLVRARVWPDRKQLCMFKDTNPPRKVGARQRNGPSWTGIGHKAARGELGTPPMGWIHRIPPTF